MACQSDTTETPSPSLPLFNGLPRTAEDEGALSPESIEQLGILMSERSPLTSSAKDVYSLPAGFTYFGQLVDHDLSHFTDENEPFNGINTLTQRTSPELDLTGIYGSGNNVPVDDSRPGCLQVVNLGTNQAGLTGWDICRGKQGKPLIGDPRNDENFMLSQLQALFIRLHNVVAAEVTVKVSPKLSSDSIRQIAKQHVQAFYYRAITQDFLKRLLFDEVWQGYFGDASQQWANWQLFNVGDMLQPNAFNLAAYRFGHCLIRPFYALNRLSSMTQTELFKYREGAAHYLHHQHIAPNDAIDWRLFFFDHPAEYKFSQVALAIRTAVPLKIPGIAEPMNRLAVRNLKRGYDQQLPSAQALLATPAMQRVMQNLSAPAGILTAETLDDGYFHAITGGDALTHHTPLWYYVLREGNQMWQADNRQRGVLGPVASIIIAAFFKLTLTQTKSVNQPLTEQLDIDSISGMSAMVRYVLNREEQ